MSELDKIKPGHHSSDPSGRKGTPLVIDAVDANKAYGELHNTPAVKESNPKDAIGCTKVPWSVLPTPVIGELALAMLEGACKYGRHNYREVGVRASIYYDAVVGRHLAAWWEGENTDADSGLSHLVKAMAGLTILRDAQIRGMMEDDRPPGTASFVPVQNTLAAEIIARHPNPKPPITSKKTPPALYLC